MANIGVACLTENFQDAKLMIIFQSVFGFRDVYDKVLLRKHLDLPTFFTRHQASEKRKEKRIKGGKSREEKTK